MTTNLSIFLQRIQGILNAIIPIIFGLAVVYFLWGLAQYILKADDEAGRQGARDIMLWGIIIIVVMVSIWGLVNIVIATIFGQTGVMISPPILPELPELP